MAIRWNFKEDKMGTITERLGGEEYTYSIYNGNAFAIIVAEWTTEDGSEMYYIHNAFADERHAKNCLGLSKEYKGDCIYEEGEVVRLTLNPKARNAKKLAELFIKTGLDITIEMKKGDK